jgi:hypothetical protein
MSYDLHFKPRTGAISPDQFAAHFQSRAHFRTDETQALYENRLTSVYFGFVLNEEPNPGAVPRYPASFTINYFRPSFFVLEAQLEVEAFVQAFDMVVLDPQNNGMGEGEFDSARMISGWNAGNELAYKTILADPGKRGSLFSLPTDELMSTWRWNRGRLALQDRLGESRFVPGVITVAIAGQLCTAVVWPDAIPAAIPEVDYLIVPRKKLAPRKFLRRAQDIALVLRSDALLLLSQHRAARFSDFLLLDYDNAPPDVTKYVESLPPSTEQIDDIPADQVLNRELVEKYAGRSAS